MDTSVHLLDINKDELRNLLNQIKAKLYELGLDKVEFSLLKRSSFGKRADKRGVLKFWGTVSSHLKDQVDQLPNELKKILKPYRGVSLSVQVEMGIGDGDKFPVISDLNVVSIRKTGKVFEFGEEDVILVDFWSTWCGPCQNPMQHNQEMLEKNEEKWKGKARIVGISLDDDIENVIKRVEERKWEKVEHYHAPGGFKSLAASHLGINSIPCVFLVDKEGIIRYRGHPSSVNLEDKINQFIKEASSVLVKREEKGGDTTLVCTSQGCSIVSVNKPSTITIDVESELLKQFQEKHELYKNLIEKCGVTIMIDATRDFRVNGEESFEGMIYIMGRIIPHEQEDIIEYWKNVIQPLPYFKLNSYLRIVDVREVNYGISCATCKKVLGKGITHYICANCQWEGKDDHAFCLDCANKELTQEISSEKDFLHKHPLLLINEDSHNSLLSLRKIVEEINIINSDHSNFAQINANKYCGYCICDGCQKEPIMFYSWICANCGDFNFCTDCIEAFSDPNHEKYQQVIQNSLRYGHDKSHLIYRKHYLMNPRWNESKDFTW